MKNLKAKLYAKFGTQINLEDDWVIFFCFTKIYNATWALYYEWCWCMVFKFERSWIIKENTYNVETNLLIYYFDRNP